ncbi:MAG: Glycoside hydrolase family 1, partial [Parcubacteria group bacterium GW2011_GWD2_43_10]
AELGENMFRFSLDFARLCPKEGEFDSALMAEYVKALALVRAHGQEPMLTMHHFTMPRYLLETDSNENITKGGWENPDVSKHFRFYVENVVKFLGDEDKIRHILASEKFDKPAQDKLLSEGLAKYFLAINEPMSTLLQVHFRLTVVAVF